jgi:oligopeptide transport system ATP-binding protein
MNSTPRRNDPEQRPAEPLLEVRGLKKWFPLRLGWPLGRPQYVRAVDGVSFSLRRGQTLGVVGESGCGKSTVGRCLLRLIPSTDGQVLFEGHDVIQSSQKQMQALRRRMQIVFQDPFGSLDPRMTIGASVGEPLSVHRTARRRKRQERVAELLSQVGMNADAAGRYPHEFSGGQRQRIGIARALALNPAFIVCDEPTSALDVSTRAQVIQLLQDLQTQQEITYLFISHDLATVRHISHHVAVMYLGKIVEYAPTDTLFAATAHPYTRVLLAAVPIPDPKHRSRRLPVTDDEIPSPINFPSGCPFHPRCPFYIKLGRPKVCRRDAPPLQPVAGNADQLASCHFAEES